MTVVWAEILSDAEETDRPLVTVEEELGRSKDHRLHITLENVVVVVHSFIYYLFGFIFSEFFGKSLGRTA